MHTLWKICVSLTSSTYKRFCFCVKQFIPFRLYKPNDGMKKKPIFQSISYTFMLSKRWMRAIRCGFLFMPWEIKLLSNIFMNMGHCVRCGFNLNIFSAFVFAWTILMDDKEEKTALNRIVYVWTLATVVWFFVYNFDSNE